MDRIVNTNLLLQPGNWIIVALMLAIAAAGLALLLGHDGRGFIAGSGSAGIGRDNNDAET